MKKQIRLVALLLSLAMLFSFVGCSNTGTSSDSSEDTAGILLDGFNDETVSTGGDSADTSETSTGSTGSIDADAGGTTVEKPVEMDSDDPFANIPKRLKGTTVTFAHFGDEGAAEYEKVLKAFTKKTGIKYKLVSYNQSEYVSQVAKQIAAKSGPDVIICCDVFPAVIEIAQPLQNIIDLSDDFWDDQITNISTVGGNTYLVNSLEGIWQNIDAVFYNKSLFSSNGLTSPLDYYNSGKWTYENFKKCCEQIKALGYVGGYADADQINAALGTPMIDYDTKTATFKSNKSDALSVGYQFTATLVKEGLWSKTDWWGTFPNGKIGIYACDIYGAKFNGYFKDMDNNDLGMVPMPTSYNGKECKPTGYLRGYGIAKGAKNPEGAAYLLRYFLDYGNYSAAGANIFKSKQLEKMFLEEILPRIKEKGINYDFAGGPMALVGEANIGMFMLDVIQADPAQVSTVIAQKQNVIDSAATKANEKIASYR